MESNEIDLRAEIARVQDEIDLFRDECLPAMLRGMIDPGAPLSAWQDAACQLAGALRSRGAPMCTDAFREFVYEARTSWRCQSGRIRWRIELFAGFDDALLWYPASKEEQQRLSASADWPAEHRLEIEAGLLSVFARGGPRNEGVDLCAVGNALCMLLPWLADVDPAFGKLALDKETWRTLVATNHALTDYERDERLRLIETQALFGNMLNNALLHVLAGLANNHFLEIREYLGHPNLRGGYTYHMPYYLFTVLFEKVAVLRGVYP